MIPYIGGKSYLANWIINNFPKDYKEKTYCEVFGGGGWVLFKKEPSYLEVYNDLNSELVNLFTMIRDNYEEFQGKAEWILHSRETYKRALEKLKDDNFISEIERALNYATIRMQSFSGGNSTGWAYQIKADKMLNGKWLPFLRRLEFINVRLKKTQIECLPYYDVINRYDKENTLFYVDPPYFGREHYYKTKTVSFEFNDHEKLCEMLKAIKGKFALSYYEHPKIREMYNGFNIITKEVAKPSAGITRLRKARKKPRATELLIMNY